MTLPSSDRRAPAAGLTGRSLTLPRDLATTAHLCVLYPGRIGAQLGVTGALLGANRLAGGGFFFDLHEAYRQGLVQGPNMMICGAGAYGKSAIAKTLVYRSSVLTPARFTAVLDPKGEWTRLGEALGWAVLRLRHGGTVRVNPFDLGPARAGADADDLLAHRAGIAVTLVAIATNRIDLPAGDRRILHDGLRLLTAGNPRDPTLPDLRRLLAEPPAALAEGLNTTPEDLADRRRPLLDAVALLAEDDLRGICDTETTINLDWANAPGLVVDLSALLTRRRTLRLVLTAAAGWLQGAMYGSRDRHKLTVVDEAWMALEDLAITRFLQDQWRLGRQWGGANILITHALSDLRSQVDDGSAAGKIAEGLLNTTSVRVFLHQNPEQVRGLLTDLGLTGTETALLRALQPFQALWKIGTQSAVVDHMIAPWEWSLCDTDQAMASS
jgi:type IV secretory pathway VirB4 component